MLTFLLTGEMPEENTPRTFLFCWSRPGEHECRHGTVETWFETWERVKDDPLVVQWKEKHGQTYAERLLEQHDADQMAS
jgi:hypothetical protein